MHSADDSAEQIFNVVPEQIFKAMLAMVTSKTPQVCGYGALSIASLAYRSQLQKKRAMCCIMALLSVLDDAICCSSVIGGAGSNSSAEIPEVSAPTAITREVLHALLNLSVLKAAQSTIVKSGLRVVLAFARAPIHTELEESVHCYASGILCNCGKNADITTFVSRHASFDFSPRRHNSPLCPFLLQPNTWTTFLMLTASCTRCSC